MARRDLLLVLALAALVAAASSLQACGPRHLSALGNPGDLCTERTACVEGTDCRITENGYRCVGPGDEASSLGSRRSGSEADEASPGVETEVDPTQEPDAGDEGEESSDPRFFGRDRRQ